MKDLLLGIICLIFSIAGFAQTTLSGLVLDEETKEPVLFGSVAVFQKDTLITGTETDIDGKYTLSNLEAGIYDIEVSYIGYQTLKVEDVSVAANQANLLNISMKSSVEIISCDYFVPPHYPPLIDMWDMGSGLIITSDQIRIWRK